MSKSIEVEYLGTNNTDESNWESSLGDNHDSITGMVKSIILSSPSLKMKYPKGIKIGTRIKITLLEN